MAEYEIQLTGEDIPARLNTLCAIEPGVYGKRWNADGSLAVMVRSERTSSELRAALESAPPDQAGPPSRRGRRPESAESAEPEA
jgi:hypothetical protein